MTPSVLRRRALALALVALPLAAATQPVQAAATAQPTYKSQIYNAASVPPLTPNDTARANDGTLYASDEEGLRIVKFDMNPPFTVTTVSPASQGWTHPSGIYLMRDQVHMWVADKDNNRVVKIDVTTGNILQAIGGTGVFNAPETITMDPAETALYVDDTYKYRVVRVDPSNGTFTWTQSNCGSSPLLRSRGLAFGTDGNLYVGDTDQSRIVELDPATGNCLNSFGSRGTAPGQFNEPRGIASDGHGGLWVAENGNWRIQHVTLTGSPLWMSPTTFGSGSNQMRSPHGVVVAGGYLYVSDTYNYRVNIYTPQSDGSAAGPWVVQEPLPATGGFDGPFGVAYDSADNLYVVDHYNSRVEKFDSTGKFITWWGGEGTPLGSFNFPRGILVEPGGDVMVCDSENHRMQVFTPSGGYLSELTPTGDTFLRPQQITLGPDGSLWAADTNHGRILNVAMNGTVLHNWVASGNTRPVGIAVDSAGNVYVSGNTVRKYSAAGALLATLAGQGSAANQVKQPDGLALTGTALYIADTGNNRIVEMTTAGKPITTFGSAGSGPGQLSRPDFIAVSASGLIAVADYGNNRISIWHT